IVAIIDAPPTPLAYLAPGGRHVALLHYGSHPPVALLARPYLALAGLRVDPRLRSRRRLRQTTGMSVLTLADGSRRDLPLPAGAQLGPPVWAPDGQRFAFTVDEPDGVGVWVADAAAGTAAQLPGLRICDVLAGEPSADGGSIRWSRDGRSLLALAAPPRPEPLPPVPIEPQVDETAGKRSQLATFQDLLRTAADEDMFEVLATSVPVRADAATGERAELGPPGLYHGLAESPDGGYLLVHQLRRPFSFRVPWSWFARTVQVWTAAGERQRVVADLDVSDEVPRQGVPTGPRQIFWEERAPAALAWIEALDGGDPVRPAEFRDRVFRLPAPFLGEPQAVFDVQHRCLGWYDLNEPHRLLLVEHDRDRRWLTTRLRDLTDAAVDQVVSDVSMDDAYADPGTPLMTTNPDGSRTALQHGRVIYLRGEGSSPEGDRPFLDQLELGTLAKTRLFHSPADRVDYVLGFALGGREEVLLWHESAAEPPNLALARLGSPGYRWQTDWPDPHPQLSGSQKRLVSYDRGDGVQLSGMLHLPPGYDPATGGRLPLLVWAYPLDYGSAATAGQIRGSTQSFTRLTALDPVFFVLRGYAVLADATMPVIGDPETMNDTYLEQITAAAQAHIRALAEMGIADPDRVAVGGHSYGGFMTANLLAHTDLFAAGIARSGAYNRTLTPFGFQTERRSFWEAREVYDRVSPFRYADKITAPLLLIHGAKDSNSGTYPIQSERLFDALRGTGGTARLVVLPHENHGYLARESVLHVLAEQFGWLDRWLGDQEPGLPPVEPEPNRRNATSAPMTTATATSR
ncbi:MAG: S9 family peptidase, partial [Actinobacteria bacterium]|nr:S9 family peptidase [Actinomycetota bacterium]